MFYFPDPDALEVPFLGHRYPECDEDSFAVFPEQCQVDITHLTTEAGDLSSEVLDDLAGFLQAWLVLGLIRRILGPSGIIVNADDFIYSSDSPSADVLNIGSIDLYLVYWKAKELQTRHGDRERSEILWKHHTEAFDLTTSVINNLMDWRTQQAHRTQDGSWVPTVLDDVLLSVILLSESLFYTGRDMLQWEFLDLEWRLGVSMRHRLLSAGWCPGEVCINEYPVGKDWIWTSMVMEA